MQQVLIVPAPICMLYTIHDELQVHIEPWLCRTLKRVEMAHVKSSHFSTSMICRGRLTTNEATWSVRKENMFPFQHMSLVFQPAALSRPLCASRFRSQVRQVYPSPSLEDRRPSSYRRRRKRALTGYVMPSIAGATGFGGEGVTGPASNHTSTITRNRFRA